MHDSAMPVRPERIIIDRERLKYLARPAPIRLLVQTGIEWACIIVLMLVASTVSNLVASLVCMLLIATRQHALLALMHEYSHFQFSRKRGWLNDLIGDIFTAFPFFITIHGFRRNHLLHHKHVSSSLDPNWVSSQKKEQYRFPKTRSQFCLDIIKHCVGRHTLAELKSYTISAGMAINLPRTTQIQRGIFAALVVAALSYSGLRYVVFLYWIMPLATFLMAILYIRDTGEHFAMPAPGIERSRTVLAGWLERLLVCQNGANFHAEHHLYPSVPFFRLRQLHQALVQNPAYRRHAVITHGYFNGLMAEISCAATLRGSEQASGV